MVSILSKSQITEIHHQTKHTLKMVKLASMEVTCDVPQGSTLEPILFFNYVKYITTTVNPENPFLFADNTTLFVQGRLKL